MAISATEKKVECEAAGNAMVCCRSVIGSDPGTEACTLHKFRDCIYPHGWYRQHCGKFLEDINVLIKEKTFF